jgi:hypothetical protein
LYSNYCYVLEGAYNYCSIVNSIYPHYELNSRVKVKVKLSRYKPGQALGVPGGWDFRIYRQSAQKGVKVVSPTHRPSLPTEKIPSTHFEPRATMRPEGLSHWNIPVTSSGIEPANFRLVAQCLKQLRHRAPPVIIVTSIIFCGGNEKCFWNISGNYTVKKPIQEYGCVRQIKIMMDLKKVYYVVAACFRFSQNRALQPGDAFKEMNRRHPRLNVSSIPEQTLASALWSNLYQRSFYISQVYCLY